MSQSYTLICLAEAVSPITHQSRSEGNESLVAREPVVTPRGIAWVPVLSGNQIRHRLVREPGWRWLIGEYGLTGHLTLPVLNFLFHGGALTERGATEDLARVASWQRLFPLGRLLGGCLPDQILAGSLQCWRGLLVCEENRPSLERILPPGVMPGGAFRPAESLIEGWQYTRSSVRTSEPDMVPALGGGTDSGLMIFAGQGVVRGACFVHGFSLPHSSLAELGALLWSLQLWQAAGGTVGGMAARGHGRLKLTLLEGDFDPEATMAEYRDLMTAAKTEAIAWLEDVFGILSRSAPSGNGSRETTTKKPRKKAAR
jgi:hypothetical protein